MSKKPRLFDDPDTLQRLQALGIRSARGKYKGLGNLDAMRKDK